MRIFCDFNTVFANHAQETHGQSTTLNVVDLDINICRYKGTKILENVDENKVLNLSYITCHGFYIQEIPSFFLNEGEKAECILDNVKHFS